VAQSFTSDEDVPAHCRGVGLDALLRSFPTQTILLYDSPKLHVENGSRRDGWTQAVAASNFTSLLLPNYFPRCLSHKEHNVCGISLGR